MVLRFNAEIVSLVACLEFEDHSQLRSIWLILGSRDDLHLRDKTRREISIPRVVACKKGSITQFGCGVVSLVNVVDPGSRPSTRATHTIAVGFRLDIGSFRETRCARYQFGHIFGREHE